MRVLHIDVHMHLALQQRQRCSAHAKPIIIYTLQVLKLSSSGKTRRIYVKRRDLLRANHLQPRDLRRIDPSLSITKTSPNISVKEHCLLVNLGGVRCTTACSISCLF